MNETERLEKMGDDEVWAEFVRLLGPITLIALELRSRLDRNAGRADWKTWSAFARDFDKREPAALLSRKPDLERIVNALAWIVEPEPEPSEEDDEPEP